MNDSDFDAASAEAWVRTVESSGLSGTDLYPALAQWVASVAPQRVVDIGCGQGVCAGVVTTPYLGIEPSPFLLARARAQYGSDRCQFVEGNAYALPLASGSVEAAFSIRVWHLLSDVPLAARELARVLRPGGPFLIITANADAAAAWVAHAGPGQLEGTRFSGADTLYFTPTAQLLSTMSDAGLSVKKVSTFRPTPAGVDAFVMVQGRREGSRPAGAGGP